MKRFYLLPLLATLFFTILTAGMVKAALDEHQQELLRTWEDRCVRECRFKRMPQCNHIRVKFERLERALTRMSKDSNSTSRAAEREFSHALGDLRPVCTSAYSRYAHLLKQKAKIPHDKPSGM